jgi:hypothetical protein
LELNRLTADANFTSASFQGATLRVIPVFKNLRGMGQALFATIEDDRTVGFCATFLVLALFGPVSVKSQ